MTTPAMLWQSAKPWRDALVKPIVPLGEGKTSPLSIRFSEALMRRLDAVAKVTGNNRSETVLHLVRWALDEYGRQRAAEKEKV